MSRRRLQKLLKVTRCDVTQTVYNSLYGTNKHIYLISRAKLPVTQWYA